jgi:hypothetical protein
MANKERGEVTLELGGESYVLVPSFGAVCEIEDALGANLFSLGRRLALAEITAREVLDLAHACLAQSGAKLDKAALGEAILEAGPLEVMAVLAEFCANYAFGGRREKKARNAEPVSAKEESAPTPNPARSSAPA